MPREMELTAVMHGYALFGFSNASYTLLSRMRYLLAVSVVALATFLVVGNLMILSFHAWAMHAAAASNVAPVEGVRNFQAVDYKLWRGSAPTMEGYKNLAARGVTTIVDLRAEKVNVPFNELGGLGINYVNLPIRDGQAPTPDQVNRFFSVVDSSNGLVYVHCMAGVGRTGAMVGAYLIQMRERSSGDALMRNMSVGPPSLEQIAFVTGEAESPNPVVTALSRVLDGPRRIWTYFH
jgi:protein tyrosine phosphatase (PTP) superfamily phosphohydrolase (DUF442 family)